MEPLSRSPLHSPAALARFFGTAIVGLVADWLTKAWTVSQLGGGRAVDLIPGWIRLEYVQNHGAVFGLAQGQRIAFLAVSVGALIFLLYLFASGGRRPFYQVLLGMLLAGVLGNMFDRIRFGYVRDMIHALPMWPRFFPWVFNIADSLLCVGVTLMLLYSFTQSAAHPTPPAAVPTEPTDVPARG